MKRKTCGRETCCDLVIQHPTVSRLHAHIELAADGLVFVRDADSRNGIYLNRSDEWIRIRTVMLCIGDRIRLGETEVPLERLISVFGDRSHARLEARHFPLPRTHMGSKLPASKPHPVSALQKPKRNPVTGKIEENHDK